MKNLILNTFSKVQLVLGRVDYRLERVETRPKDVDIPSKTVVVVGHKELPKWALMRCPCGCGEILILSLMKRFRNYWQYETDTWGRITLTPSVWKNDGCRSHFILKKGKVVWCKNYGINLFVIEVLAALAFSLFFCGQGNYSLRKLTYKRIKRDEGCVC